MRVQPFGVFASRLRQWFTDKQGKRSDLYSIGGSDTGIDLIDYLPFIERCTGCGRALNKGDVYGNPNVDLQSKYDVLEMRDGFKVVSKRFVNVYNSNGLRNLLFHQVSPSFFAVECNFVVRFDAERRGTRFENKCSACGQYESVVGASPAFLLPGERIGEKDFAWSDLHFATLDEQHPCLYCGGEAAQALRMARLRGIYILEEPKA